MKEYNQSSSKRALKKKAFLFAISLQFFFIGLIVSGNLWVDSFGFYIPAALFISTLVVVFFTRAILKNSSAMHDKLDKSALTTRRFQNIAKYFESILQDSSDIIFSVDTEGLILKFNSGSELHFGYTQHEIVGMPLSRLFVNEIDERKILSTVLLRGKSSNEEVPMKTKEGKIILLNLSMSEMKNDSNQIIGLVVTAKDITEKKKLEMELVKKNEQLSKLAITDSLTDLYNSRHFFSQIKRELSRIRRHPDQALSMILLDIDRFKELNDTQGHQMGDHVLHTLGEVIQGCIRRDIDTAFRYGGDEFIILLPDTDKDQARIAAERIQKQFATYQFGSTSLSIGISQAVPDETEKSFIKRADEAMYDSKRNRKGEILCR